MNASVDTQTLLGLVLRTLIASAAGGLIARGELSPTDVDTLAGGGLIILVGGWSWLQKRVAARKHAKQLAAAQAGTLVP